ncbi:serine protease [Lunasporangiospora selenospora]|uniref:Serine protease n=1 Tax=Lunasporangiospora selenospora TaxID=979761 RepID=A0A9P6FJK9_9FUNG|nr:serine protease [Lunasporangiospora selenospora]
MASPHVAGLIAYFLALIPENDSAFYSGPLTPKEMKAYLKARATRDALDDIDRRTPNLLIYNGIPNDDYLAW